MPPIAIITGSAGLVGSESVRQFIANGYTVVGMDNDMRGEFFGAEASTRASRESLIHDYPAYRHLFTDISSRKGVETIFDLYGKDIAAVIHAAAQPSHDWAARNPHLDFAINATGTLNLLEATRLYCPKAAFVFCSTNKVYGDGPNRAVFTELPTRFEVLGSYGYYEGYDDSGVNESMSVDHRTHSLFGCSKLAADLLVQEYGRYFGMNTVCFRGGCLTGPGHAGAKLHGFLSYLVKCAVAGETYSIIGHRGKQVRDNLHASDLVAAFREYVAKPRPGEVYNIGGGRERSCSIIEAIELVDRIAGTRLEYEHIGEPRIGDHKWWITDTRKFERDYPAWRQRHSLEETVAQIVESHAKVVAQ